MINIVYRLKSPKFFEEAIDEVDLDGVVVRPTHLSICQADQRYYQGSRPSEVLDEKLPMALIHEAIGEVVFDSKGNFKSGDKVVMIPNTPLCDDIYAPNYSYNSKFRGSGFDGFTSDLINLPSDRVVKIPDDFNLNVSAFIELISVAYQGINKFKQIAITPKDNLGVWGDGNLGFITALLLKELFPESKVIVFGKHQENLNLFSFADEICRIHDVDGVTIYRKGQGQHVLLFNLIDVAFIKRNIPMYIREGYGRNKIAQDCGLSVPMSQRIIFNIQEGVFDDYLPFIEDKSEEHSFKTSGGELYIDGAGTGLTLDMCSTILLEYNNAGDKLRRLNKLVKRFREVDSRFIVIVVNYLNEGELSWLDGDVDDAGLVKSMDPPRILGFE